jgi:flavodoxin
MLGRRSFLVAVAAVLGALAGIQLSGRSSPTSRKPDPPDGVLASGAASDSVLVAYFSRAGENYSYGGRTHLDVGNTEVLAGMISGRLGSDVYRIEAAEPYSDDYEETVERNVQEQNADARPAIAKPLPSIDQYDTILLGSPIWNVRAPMMMSTFTESLDFTGKTVHPFTTYAMSGLGTTERDYARSCRGATIGNGLAVRGEEVWDASAAVASWLRDIGLLQGGAPEPDARLEREARKPQV